LVSTIRRIATGRQDVSLSAETVQVIIDNAASDPDFTHELLVDPGAALDARGIALPESELAELQDLVARANEPTPEMVEELQARISHSLVGHGEMASVLLIENFLRSAAEE
jgi:hypothetical protein